SSWGGGPLPPPAVPPAVPPPPPGPQGRAAATPPPPPAVRCRFPRRCRSPSHPPQVAGLLERLRLRLAGVRRLVQRVEVGARRGVHHLRRGAAAREALPLDPRADRDLAHGIAAGRRGADREVLELDGDAGHALDRGERGGDGAVAVGLGLLLAAVAVGDADARARATLAAHDLQRREPVGVRRVAHGAVVQDRDQVLVQDLLLLVAEQL